MIKPTAKRFPLSARSKHTKSLTWRRLVLFKDKLKGEQLENVECRTGKSLYFFPPSLSQSNISWDVVLTKGMDSTLYPTQSSWDGTTIISMARAVEIHAPSCPRQAEKPSGESRPPTTCLSGERQFCLQWWHFLWLYQTFWSSQKKL